MGYTIVDVFLKLGLDDLDAVALQDASFCEHVVFDRDSLHIAQPSILLQCHLDPLALPASIRRRRRKHLRDGLKIE